MFAHFALCLFALLHMTGKVTLLRFLVFRIFFSSLIKGNYDEIDTKNMTLTRPRSWIHWEGVFTSHSVCVCMWCGPALVFIAAAAEAAVVTEATAAPSRSCTRLRVTAAPVLNGLVLTE